MTTDQPDSPAEPMTWPFPQGGPMVRLAYRELNIAANGDPDQVRALGDIALLPRPWDPATCRRPELREQLWEWLEHVVCWVNHEYVWDIAGMIPSCWPLHPHLTHEVAVLADQRRRAGLALTSDAMEEWHRYALPAFVDRMRARMKDHCEDGHHGWPARSRYTRHTSQISVDERQLVYRTDIQTTMARSAGPVPAPDTQPRAHLASVNLDTGEVTDP